jgi:hypothetical protein
MSTLGVISGTTTRVCLFMAALRTDKPTAEPFLPSVRWPTRRPNKKTARRRSPCGSDRAGDQATRPPADLITKALASIYAVLAQCEVKRTVLQKKQNQRCPDDTRIIPVVSQFAIFDGNDCFSCRSSASLRYAAACFSKSALSLGFFSKRANISNWFASSR